MPDEEYFGPADVPAGLRPHTEPEPTSGRSEAERDRDRVLYSSAFQRLSGITQIASPEAGQVFHNRLTHSLKVSQLGKRLAQRLVQHHHLTAEQLDPDVVEAAALAHDLGHPPFGHIAEEELNELAAAWGGFEGNPQSFRIVSLLALRHLDYRGLNLTWRTLNGMLKYPWLRVEGDPIKGKKWGAYASEQGVFVQVRHGLPADQPALEAQIMDWADDVTYAVHDMEDFHRAGLVPLDRLASSEDERNDFFDSFFTDGQLRTTLRGKFSNAGLDVAALESAFGFLFEDFLYAARPYGGTRRDRAFIRERTSALIGRFAVDGVEFDETQSRLRLDDAQRAEVAVLKELAWHYVINRPSLAIVQEGQRRIIRDLHKLYREAANEPDRWKLFPQAQRELLEVAPDDDRKYRVVTDLIAGLTESMAFALHQRLTGATRGSILDAAAQSAR
jgi:dGTPase